MEIVILANPKGKARARVVSRGGRTWAYSSEDTVHSENLIRDKAMECGEYYDVGIPLKLRVVFFLEKPKSVSKKRTYPVVCPDLDNMTKLVTDSLEKFIYKNDAQIVDCYIQKRYGSPPRIELSIEALG